MTRMRTTLHLALKLPYLPVWLAPLILFSPLYLTGRVLFWGVPLLQFVPWWKVAWDTLLAGHLPLWNPWVGMGAPLLGNYQSALLYPPTWSYLLGYWVGGQGFMAWLQAILLALHLAWSGLGMVFLVRRQGLGRLSQAVAGLAYGLSGYLVARASFLSINAAVAWLPWILLCLTPIPGPLRWRSRGFLLAVVCLTMQLLAGHAQSTWYTLLLAGLWVAFWAWQQPCQQAWQQPRQQTVSAGLQSDGQVLGEAGAVPVRWPQRLGSVLKAEIVMGLAVCLAVFIAAAQLFPTAEYLLQSQRSSAVDYKFAMNYSFWPWHFLTLLAPGMFGSPASGDYWGYAYIWEDAIYIGLLPLLLALGALLKRKTTLQDSLVYGRSLANLRWFLLVVILMAGLFALGSNTPVFPWLYRNVPTFAMFQAPARWMLWGVAALSLLAALGAETWRRPQGRGLYWTRLGTMGAFAITLGAGLAWISLGEVSPSFIRAVALMGLWALLAGILSLVAPPRPGASNVAVAPKKAAALQIKAFEGLEKRLGQALAGMAARINPPGQPYPLQRWQAAVAGLVALDLIIAGWGLNPPADPGLYTQPAPTAAQLKAGLASPGGAHRLYMPHAQEQWFTYTRFLWTSSFDPGQDWMSLRAGEIPDVNILDEIATAGNFDPLVPGRFAGWLESLDGAPPKIQNDLLRLMDVGMVASNDRRAPYGLRFRPVPDPVSRFRWVPHGLAAAGPAQARELVFSGEVDFSDRVVLEKTTPSSNCLPLKENAPEEVPVGEVKIENPNPNRTQVQLTKGAPGWLVIADTWYPGWCAWVDGKPASIWRANYLFRAVQVEAGSHTVTLEYRPFSFYLGLLASLLGLLIFAGGWRLSQKDHA
jgi:hypothetical protein